MADVATLAFWALITGGTPLVLAAVPILRARLTDRTTHVMLGLSAGILLGLSFLNVLPESFEAADAMGLPSQAVPLGAAAGFFVLMLIERQVFHRGHPPATDEREGGAGPHGEDGHAIHPFGTLALSALTIHGLVDGFVIPLGFELGPTAGTVIVLAVALHQIPDSFAALAVGLASTRSPRAALGFILATAVDTPVGILLGLLFLGIGTSWVAVGLAFSAGTFLFVSAADLIPELQHRSRSLLVSLSIILGFAAIGLLAFLPG